MLVSLALQNETISHNWELSITKNRVRYKATNYVVSTRKSLRDTLNPDFPRGTFREKLLTDEYGGKLVYSIS